MKGWLTRGDPAWWCGWLLVLGCTGTTSHHGMLREEHGYDSLLKQTLLKDNFQATQLLLANAASPNMLFKVKQQPTLLGVLSGQVTPLHWAICQEDERLVSLLVKHQADVDASAHFQLDDGTAISESPLVFGINQALDVVRPSLVLAALLQSPTAKTALLGTDLQGNNLLDQVYRLYDQEENGRPLGVYRQMIAAGAAHSASFEACAKACLASSVGKSDAATLHFHLTTLAPTTQRALLASCHGTQQKTLLHLAAEKGHIGVGKVLLEHGAAPNATYQGKVLNWHCSALVAGQLTPLHLAVCNRQEAFARLLLADRRTDFRVLDDQGRTLLDLVPSPYDHFAKDSRLAQTALQLLSKVTEPYPWYRLLEKYGVQHGASYRQQVFERLVKQLKSFSDKPAEQLSTLITQALAPFSPSTRKAMLNQPTNKRGFALLHWAAKRGKTGLVLALVGCGANVRQPTKPRIGAFAAAPVEEAASDAPLEEETPLQVALANKQYTTANELIQVGADLPNDEATRQLIAAGQLMPTNAYVKKLLETDNEAKAYDRESLYAILRRLPPARLYGRAFPGGRTLLHELAPSPNHAHTQGVEAYIKYLSEHAMPAKTAAIQAGVAAWDKDFPPELSWVIAAFTPSLLDITDDAGQTATDAAYSAPQTPFEERSYAYPLLQKYGGHHSEAKLEQLIQTHLDAEKPPYDALMVRHWQQRQWGEQLFTAAVQQMDLDLVWLLLGQDQYERNPSPDYRGRAEALVNAQFNKSDHRKLLPGYSMLGYCHHCKEMVVVPKGFTISSGGEVMYVGVASSRSRSSCPVCHKRLYAKTVQKFILNRCNCVLRRSYKSKQSIGYCDGQDVVLTNEHSAPPLYADCAYMGKTVSFQICVTPLATNQQLPSN